MLGTEGAIWGKEGTFDPNAPQGVNENTPSEQSQNDKDKQNEDVSSNESFSYQPYAFNQELAETCALYSALAYQEARITCNSGNLETFFYTLGKIPQGSPMPTSMPPTKEILFLEFLSHYKELKDKGEIVYFSGKREDSYVTDKNRDIPVVLQAQLEYDGFTAIVSKNYHNEIENDISYTFAHKKVNDDETLFAVILRGTDYVEWRGNMDIGEDSKRHKSFETAKSCLKDAINNYITTNQLKDKINFLITGHSRGAAVANLLAVDLNDKQIKINGLKNVYAYTFATPNNIKRTIDEITDELIDLDKNGTNIFNFCFADDFVPQVPLSSIGWNYGKGLTYFAVAENLNKINPDFSNSVKGKVFNYKATLDVLQAIHKIAPTIDDYYNKKLTMEPLHGLTEDLYNFFVQQNIPFLPKADPEEDKTLYEFMRDYIANAKIYGLGDISATVGSALKQLNGNDVHDIAVYFVDGLKARQSVGDTHDMWTYYYALISNGFATE
jgi:hypothetical protein